MSVLVLAGHDPSGRAGLTRDLWTLARCALPALSLPTCSTIQTKGLQVAQASDARWLERALEALRDEHAIRVIKTGLILSGETWSAILPMLRALASEGAGVVVDPCRGPSRGGFGADDGVRRALLGEVAATRAAVLTPNVPELAWLHGAPLADEAAEDDACRALLARGYRAVVLKGGHARGAPESLRDRYFAQDDERSFVRERHAGERRGTGCCFASFLAAGLWQDLDVPTAARIAGHQLGQVWHELAAPED